MVFCYGYTIVLSRGWNEAPRYSPRGSKACMWMWESFEGKQSFMSIICCCPACRHSYLPGDKSVFCGIYLSEVEKESEGHTEVPMTTAEIQRASRSGPPALTSWGCDWVSSREIILFHGTELYFHNLCRDYREQNFIRLCLENNSALKLCQEEKNRKNLFLFF